MNYLRHVVTKLRPAGRAEGPCIGSIGGIESITARYLNSFLTAISGVGAGMFFVGWEIYGEKILDEQYHITNNSNRTFSYREHPLRALNYDVKMTLTYDFPRIGRALWAAPKYIGKTALKGTMDEKMEMGKDIINSLWTGLTSETIAFVPASFVVERLIPVGKDIGLREPEYWLSWFGALATGWATGTLGIALKLGWDDYRREKKSQINSK